MEFGLYVARDSAVERADPRLKILLAFACALTVILPVPAYVKFAIVAVLLGVWVAARLGVKLLAITLASLAFFFVTTLVLRAVIRGARAADVVYWGPTPISGSGALDGLQMCAQILAVVLSLTILVRTTAPTELGGGIEDLLGWSGRLGVPVHEAVMMFTISLRFLPVMVEEFERLQTAQLARGGGVQRGSLTARLRAIGPMLIPLVIVTLGRAKELSEAMESRCYRGDVDRTRLPRRV